jgi:hypothetical protein
MKSFRGSFLVTLFALLASWAQAQLNIVFDYSMDTNGYFTTPRRDTLDQAANYLESFMTGQTLAAINPTGTINADGTAGTGNRWNAAITNPQTGSINNIGINAAPNATVGLNIAANTVVVYVGARSLGGAIATGLRPGMTTTTAFSTTVIGRGVSGTVMGSVGSIAFNNSTSFYFDNDITTVESFAGQVDFFSVAVHELIHVLGVFNGSTITVGANTFNFGWTSNTNTATNPDTFFGTDAVASYGGVINLASDASHWAEGVQSTIAGNPDVGGTQEALMDPTVSLGFRKYISELDLAALADIGYTTNDSAMLVNILPIPEPSTYAVLFGAGALALSIGYRRRRV